MPPAVEASHLELWIEAFRGPLVGLIASWCADWRRAQELAQDTFAEAWLARATFRAEPNDLPAVGAWLRGIALRLHAAAARREVCRAAVPLTDALPAPAVDDEHDERRALLVAAFTKLRQEHQTVLRMHYLDESSAYEVACLLGITAKAVESRLYQARKALRYHAERLQRATARGARA